MAKLIDELGTSTTDAHGLVRGLLQASITRGLQAKNGRPPQAMSMGT